MLVSLALTAHRRPHYLRETLSTIRTSVAYAMKMDPSLEFVLVPSLEIDFPEMREIVESVDFVKCIPHWNKHRLGMNQNTLMSFIRAFEHGDVAVEINEDVVYSEDYLWYAVSMLRMYEDDESVLHSTIYDTRTDQVWRICGVHFCGIVTWRDRWQWFQEHWPSASSPSYDCFLWDAFPRDKYCISPIVSRSKHIGVEGGTYANPIAFEKNPDPLWCGNFEPATEWEEVPLWKHGEELTNQYQFKPAPGCENTGWNATEYYDLLHKLDRRAEIKRWS
jgi:hypothetical protein